MEFIRTTEAPAAIGPYSQAVRVGETVFCSGQIPIDPETGTLTGNDVESQTLQIFKNMKAVLKTAGLSLDHIVKTTVFMKNLDDFSMMNAVYEKCLGGHKPARSTIEVAKIPMDALVEIECIAYGTQSDI